MADDDFYTSVNIHGKNILFRGIINGKRTSRKFVYKPTLFLPSTTPTKFQTIHGEYVEPTWPGTIPECREKIKDHAQIANSKIHGMTHFECAFISDLFEEDIKWNRQLVNVCNIDIEVGSENGFPDPAIAQEQITAITFKMGKKFFVFGYDGYTNNRPDVTYIECTNEIDLIKRFLDCWSSDYPDVITGWNVAIFDMPYLINRINKLLGEKWAKRISPWDYFREKTLYSVGGREQKVYVISGISILDYYDLYRKFAPHGKSQESYKLDHICFVEIGERKLKFTGNLHRLYKDNYQKFIEYNIRDVELVDKLDNKLRLLDLAFTLAFGAKVNLEDIFFQTRMWNALTYNELRRQKLVMPPQEKQNKSSAYVGAFVKEPTPGLYHWMASFDVNSLYPSLIRQYNIGPDTIVEPEDYDQEMGQLVSQASIENFLAQKVDTGYIHQKGVGLTPNGCFYRNDKESIMAVMVRKMTEARKTYKSAMLEAKKRLELVNAELDRRQKDG